MMTTPDTNRDAKVRAVVEAAEQYRIRVRYDNPSPDETAAGEALDAAIAAALSALDTPATASAPVISEADYWLGQYRVMADKVAKLTRTVAPRTTLVADAERERAENVMLLHDADMKLDSDTADALRDSIAAYGATRYREGEAAGAALLQKALDHIVYMHNFGRHRIVAAVDGALDEFMKSTSAVTGDGKNMLDEIRTALRARTSP